MSEEENVFSFYAIVGCEYYTTFNVSIFHVEWRMGKTCFKGFFFYFRSKKLRQRSLIRIRIQLNYIQSCMCHVLDVIQKKLKLKKNG